MSILNAFGAYEVRIEFYYSCYRKKMARVIFFLVLMLLLADIQLWPSCFGGLFLQWSATLGSMAISLDTIQVSLHDSVQIVREIVSLLGTLEDETGKVFSSPCSP